MSGQEELSDEYVVKALQADAKARSNRYLSIGLQAFLPSRATAAAPKPNTRFLMNVLRETNSHNAALLAKEQREARARQKTLERNQVGRLTPPLEEARRRERERMQQQNNKSGKRGRTEDSHDIGRRKRPHRENHEKSQSSRLSRRETAPHSSRREERKPHYDYGSDTTAHSLSPNRNRKYRKTAKSGDERGTRDCYRHERRCQCYADLSSTSSSAERHRYHKSHRKRSPTPSDTPSISPERHRRQQKTFDRRNASFTDLSEQYPSSLRARRRKQVRHHQKRRPSYSESDSTSASRERLRKHRKASSNQKNRVLDQSPPLALDEERIGPQAARPVCTITVQSQKQTSEIHSDSDPLEAIVGPLPPPRPPKVRKRGRGAFVSANAIDSHFSTSYNPAVDVRPNSDEESDWEQALEAMRDRERYKQHQAERMRAAGFNDSVVTHWEKGGRKDETDVTWAKKGEGREWDRGKLVDSDGDVEVRADWGRLKDT